MCGIFAYIQQGKLSPEDFKVINEYFSRIKHRGPDYTSRVVLEKFGCTIFLGFHRLAIIDPSEASNPLLQDGDVYIVCNGEIYNYKYLIEKYTLPVRTGSDCEVILQLYKHYPQLWPEILEELDGVFAFVLYDHNTGTILTSRDRVGVRPMFEGISLEAMAFASEGKAIPLDNARPYRPGLFKTIELASKDLRRGWVVEQHRWEKAGLYMNIPYVTAQGIMRDLFTEAVRKRLMADRPIGFLVSGGLDSSLVAAVAHRLIGKKITTFSIGLPGSPDLAAAARVAAYLDSDHHEVIISTKDIIDALPEVVYHDETYDITTIRASIPMYLISKYIREHTDIKVIFSGEGADELLGGYLYFHKAPTFQAFQNETVRLKKELYKYDLLRGDRTTSAWGLEIRVPFLDAAFMNFVINIDPAHKMPQTHTIEKAIMRHAFDGYLPAQILYRQKEAFSDGVGYNSVVALKNQAEKESIHCDDFIKGRARPETKEAHMYYMLFRQNYADRPNLHPEYYWMPLWHDGVTDPSARVLDTHNSSQQQ